MEKLADAANSSALFDRCEPPPSSKGTNMFQACWFGLETLMDLVLPITDHSLQLQPLYARCSCLQSDKQVYQSFGGSEIFFQELQLSLVDRSSDTCASALMDLHDAKTTELLQSQKCLFFRVWEF